MVRQRRMNSLAVVPIHKLLKPDVQLRQRLESIQVSTLRLSPESKVTDFVKQGLRKLLNIGKLLPHSRIHGGRYESTPG